MGKDPRFNFYPDNFEGGTDGFTLEQDGAYIRLLILQFRKGTFTEEQALDKLAMHCRGNAVAYTTLWKFLMPKFIPENFDGVNYYNERMALEVSKSKKTSERQTVTALKRWRHDKNGNAVASATEYPTASATGDAFSSNSSISNKEKKRTTVKRKSTEVDFSIVDNLIPEGWPADQFRSVFREFWDMRIAKGKPLTENAVKRRISQLCELSGGSYQLAEKICLRSTDARWDEFYPMDKSQISKPSQNGRIRDKF